VARRGFYSLNPLAATIRVTAVLSVAFAVLVLLGEAFHAALSSTRVLGLGIADRSGYVEDRFSVFMTLEL
jgi:hypothetical protein